MNAVTFLQKNLAWTFHKNRFSDLCGQATSKSQLVDQLHALADKYFPQRAKILTVNVEFCLNEIALKRPKTREERALLQRFDGYWQSFVRVKEVFAKNFATFPADGTSTRLEQIARLIVQCTQCAYTKAQRTEICEKVKSTFDLEEREFRNLENALTLAEISFFCAVGKGIFDGEDGASVRLAKMTLHHPLKTELTFNSRLRHAYYSTRQLVANVDCLANSATKFTVPTAIDVKTNLYCCGKNVFDTFCLSKFGKKTAEFSSESSFLKTEMQYFVYGSCEVRKFTLHNDSDYAKNVIADFSLRHLNASNKTTFFQTNGALCLAVCEKENFYCALAAVTDNEIVQCPFEEGRISLQLQIKEKSSVQVDLVTIFAENMPSLAQKLAFLNTFGATRCPYLLDEVSDSLVNFDVPLSPTPHGYEKRSAPKPDATALNFTYQLGTDNVATFLDNNGNNTTLLNGFVFGVSGEKVCAVKNGAITQLNCDKFQLQSDKIVFEKPNGASCTISHAKSKKYFVRHPVPCKTLFYFPLEEKCKVTFQNNVFFVDGVRKFAVKCVGKVESYSTNALECNTERMRYKLSCETDCGTALAICFATSATAELELCSSMENPKPTPLIKESLVSTYLNYVNGKNVFCLANYLKRADSLTLAAITFTNPQFVRQFVTKLNNGLFYYDSTGRKRKFYDRLALPLATAYYVNLCGDLLTPELRHKINGILFNERFEGTDLCIKALALKKIAQIKGFDKVRCLSEYERLKKVICADKKLFEFAQAIGAVPMQTPTKERLRELCNAYAIPKSWYYVSQLENLYGMSLCGGVLNFAPKTTQTNVLEQLAVFVDGKKIDTTFQRAAERSMTLNGVKYFSPFQTQSLKNTQNTLIVSY